MPSSAAGTESWKGRALFIIGDGARVGAARAGAAKESELTERVSMTKEIEALGTRYLSNLGGVPGGDPRGVTDGKEKIQYKNKRFFPVVQKMLGPYNRPYNRYIIYATIYMLVICLAYNTLALSARSV